MPMENTPTIPNLDIPEVEHVLPSKVDMGQYNPRVSSRHSVTSMTPTPLAEFLQDSPHLGSRTSRSKSRSRRGSASTSKRETKEMIALVLAEEERQANQLKSVLRSTSDRLEQEIRRAQQAEKRAEQAELRAIDLTSRVTAAEGAKLQADLEASRSKDEANRYIAQMESMDKEMKRLQAEVKSLQKQRDTAQQAADRASDVARRNEIALKDYEAREESREELRRLGMQKWFDKGEAEGWEAGRDEGFEDGRANGYQEGLKIGRAEGFEDGVDYGRAEERDHALQAFDRFLQTEFNEEDPSYERTRSWAQTAYPRAGGDTANTPISPVSQRPRRSRAGLSRRSHPSLTHRS